MTQLSIQNKEIRPQVVKQLTAATSSILLAIGWLEDPGIIGLLQKKAIEGLDVQLILVNDEKSKAKEREFQLLVQKGAKVVWLDNTFREKLIDYKFGIIDSMTVLTGTYSWQGQHFSTDEILYLTHSLPTLAKGFEIEFEYLSILNQLSKEEPKLKNPVTVLLKKLEIIKALLKIGDTEFIYLRLKEIQDFKSDINLAPIITDLEEHSFEEALGSLMVFTEYHETLIACNEPPVEKLRREIQFLEEEIAAASNSFSEIEKTLHKFSKRHSEILGDLLQEILYQTRIKAKIEAEQDEEDEEKQDEYYEAKNDYEEYTHSYEFSKKQKLKVLTKEEQKQLKKLYRQNSLKCHPDRVIEEFQTEAEAIFVKLNEAYKANDLEKVKTISDQLKGGFMLFKSEGITELKKLESTLKKLTQKYNGWIDKIEVLQNQPTYRTIHHIEDWDIYFSDTKEVLKSQLERLREFNEGRGSLVE